MLQSKRPFFTKEWFQLNTLLTKPSSSSLLDGLIALVLV